MRCKNLLVSINPTVLIPAIQLQAAMIASEELIFRWKFIMVSGVATYVVRASPVACVYQEN